LRGWNCAWSSTRTAPATGKGQTGVGPGGHEGGSQAGRSGGVSFGADLVDLVGRLDVRETGHPLEVDVDIELRDHLGDPLHRLLL
jgi:hypothetical protein